MKAALAQITCVAALISAGLHVSDPIAALAAMFLAEVAFAHAVVYRIAWRRSRRGGRG